MCTSLSAVPHSEWATEAFAAWHNWEILVHASLSADLVEGIIHVAEPVEIRDERFDDKPDYGRVG